MLGRLLLLVISVFVFPCNGLPGFTDSIFSTVGGPFVFTAPASVPFNMVGIRVWGAGGT